MSRVTEGHLVRHYQGAKGGRDAALLDIAQDHALHLLHEVELFDQGLVFKGGTALRKFRAGNAGRFSTDLDFAAPGEDLPLAVLSALDGAELDGFSFAVENLGDDGRCGDLRIVQGSFRSEDIGYLTRRVRIDEWIATVQSRYAFLADLDASERRWAECNERDLYEVETELAVIGG